MQINPAMKILLENAKSYSERNEVMGLMEAEAEAVNNTMVSNLYKSAIEKAYIDFDDIPESKGDITRYSGYSSMVQVLDLIEQLSVKYNTKVPEVQIVRDAISNITAYRDSFEKGFKLEKEFIILLYNSMVYATVEATSIIISSYVDFVKRPDAVEFTIIKDRTRGGHTVIQNLQKFNKSVKNGDLAKVLRAVINTGKENLIGIDDLVVPTIIIGAVITLVPLIRELIFGFYYSRMRLSDYLEQQAMLLEINKQNIESSNRPAREKTRIVKKQERTIQNLHRLSEKIKVDNKMSDSKATVELHKENKAWTIGDVKSQSASTDTNGFQLL